MTTQDTCPDCGVAVGQSHINECDIERCSACGRQRITCDCEGHDSMASAWNGKWPRKDDPDATRIEENGVEHVPIGQSSMEQPRTAEDVYWDYVEKVGQEACDFAVANYLDIDGIVEFVLENSTPELLEEYLHDNLIVDEAEEPAGTENPQTDNFLEGFLDFPHWQEEKQRGGVDWRHDPHGDQEDMNLKDQK